MSLTSFENTTNRQSDVLQFIHRFSERCKVMHVSSAPFLFDNV